MEFVVLTGSVREQAMRNICIRMVEALKINPAPLYDREATKEALLKAGFGDRAVGELLDRAITDAKNANANFSAWQAK